MQHTQAKDVTGGLWTRFNCCGTRKANKSVNVRGNEVGGGVGEVVNKSFTPLWA